MPVDPLNYVNVGPEGTFKKSGKYFTTPADVDRIFDHLQATHQHRLVVHFHGGLVAENAGMKTAERMATELGDVAHAVTVVWETGAGETITRNLKDLNSTKLFNKIVNIAIQKASKRLGIGVGSKGAGFEMTLAEVQATRDNDAQWERLEGQDKSGIAGVTETDLRNLEPDIELDVQAEIEADPEIAELLLTEAPRTRLLADGLKADSEAARGPAMLTVVKAVVAIVVAVIRRFLRDRDHGVLATVIEETLRELYLADLGAWVWGEMKNLAAQMFEENVGPVTEASKAGSYLIDRLAERCAADPELRVTLIGHSAGSIAVCHLLNSVEQRHPGLKFDDVVFLAPAATCALFNEYIIAASSYSSYRSFILGDEFEKKDKLLGGVYPHSLLYFVSGALESAADTPVSGMQRHVSGHSPYSSGAAFETHTFLGPSGGDRLVVSKVTTGDPGHNTTAETHGGIDEDPVTLASVKTIIQS
jgi:hypothetical protein